MNQIYRAIGMTKQNFHQRLNRLMEERSYHAQIIALLHKIRKDHPKMGGKGMYYKVRPEMGREKFLELYMREGFRVKQRKNFRRTTDSSGVIRFPNRVEGIELTGINQVWVSDITYYEIAEKFYYLTLIMDLYSRRIVGYSASRSLSTEQTTCPALKKALRGKEKQEVEGLIIHSDGGGQYYSRLFTSITNDWNIQNSMARGVYENSHAERLNKTIKYNYLDEYAPSSFEQLAKELNRAVRMYNFEKPHESLNHLSPMEFERYQQQLTELTKEKKKQKKKIYSSSNNSLKTVNSI